MAVTIVATAGASDANSYVTLAEYTDYINLILSSSDRDLVKAASSDDKSRSLILATKALDYYVDWIGEIPSESTQSLAWPRAYATDYFGRDILNTVIPDFIKEYTLQTAAWLIVQAGALPAGTSSQLNSVKLGSLAVDFNTDANSPDLYLPKSVISALEPVGTYNVTMANAMHTAWLVRT